MLSSDVLLASNSEVLSSVSVWYSSPSLSSGLMPSTTLMHLIFLFKFRVLFREQGILLFFHVGKMTTHRVRIPRFCCGYFRPRVCVCVLLFGPVRARPFFFNSNVDWSCENSRFLLQLFPDCCASVWHVLTLRDKSRVKIPRFRCGYFRTVYVCVCVCVCVRVCRDTGQFSGTCGL